MNFKNLIMVIMILSLFSFGCTKKIDVEAELASLMKTDFEFAQTSVKLNPADAFNKYLADDAIMMPAGGNPINGRELIFEGMKEGEYQLLWVPQAGKVASSGDFGYTWGKYEYIYQNSDGDTVIAVGKYVNVWEKDESGSWKVLVDMGNSSPKQ
jgi:ketosteroid isomerase-like protein